MNLQVFASWRRTRTWVAEVMHHHAPLPVHPCLSALMFRALHPAQRRFIIAADVFLGPFERNTQCSRRRFTKLWHVLLLKWVALYSILYFPSTTGILGILGVKLCRNRNSVWMFIASDGVSNVESTRKEQVVESRARKKNVWLSQGLKQGTVWRRSLKLPEVFRNLFRNLKKVKTLGVNINNFPCTEYDNVCLWKIKITH